MAVAGNPSTVARPRSRVGSGSTMAKNGDQKATELRATEAPLDPDAVIRFSSSDKRALAGNGIFVLASIFMLHFAASLLIPITVALLLFLLLSRPARALDRIGVPPVASAFLSVAFVTAVLFGLVYLLSAPAKNWIERLPSSFYKVEQKIRAIKEPIKQTEEAIRKVEEAAEIAEDPKVQKVEIKSPGFLNNIFTGTPQLLTSLGSAMLLLLFLLASGDTFVRKLVSVSPTLADKKRAIEITRNIQNDISFYLLTITLLNIGVGLLTALYCQLSGVADPLLWGSLATLFGFAPFVGPVLMAGTLTLVGMLEFDEIFMALTVPFAYLIAVFIFNSLILPLVLGRRLTLNPVAIFLAIMFWGWLWGVPGILLAVPVLASIKIICERIEPLQPVAEFFTP